MCELFAKSSRHPATINLALPVFAAHGGRTGPHRDGWGFAYYEDTDIRLIKDTRQAADSPWVRFIEDQGLRAHTVIGHIRNATTGAVTISNTHPFSRELGGRMHVFAHNGVVDPIFTNEAFAPASFHPVGTTDSEFAFCALLARLAPLWRDGVPALERRLAVVAAFAADLRALGPANFLYSDSVTLFAHSHLRHQDDGTVRPPGLHLLRLDGGTDQVSMTGGGVDVQLHENGSDSIVLASVPLSDDGWEPVAQGTVLAIENGIAVANVTAS